VEVLGVHRSHGMSSNGPLRSLISEIFILRSPIENVRQRQKKRIPGWGLELRLSLRTGIGVAPNLNRTLPTQKEKMASESSWYGEAADHFHAT
jgi:hypothetical protein